MVVVVVGVFVLFLIITPVNILVRGFRSRTRRKCDAAVMPVFMEAGVGDSSPVLATASTSRSFTVARGWAFPGNVGGEVSVFEVDVHNNAMGYGSFVTESVAHLDRLRLWDGFVAMKLLC